MKKKRIRLFATLALLTLIAGTVLNLPVFSQTGFGSITPAAAQEVGQPQVFLPMVFGKYPMVTSFGVEMHDIADGGGLQQVSDAGIHWVRKNGLLWSATQPNESDPPDFNAAADLNTELKNAAQQNLKVILIVRSTPAWALKHPNPEPTCGPIAQDKFDAFGQFLQAAVAYYSKPPFNVHYWELYNEPDKSTQNWDDVWGCWGEPSASNHLYGGDYYGQMLSAVYPYIKAADPTAQVLNGGLLMGCAPAQCASDDYSYRFLEGMLQTGANGLDGISFHSYDYAGKQFGFYSNPNWNSSYDTTGPVVLPKADFIRQIMDQTGVTGKYLVNSEAALVNNLSDTCDATCEQNKAYYVGQLYSAGIEADLKINIWYALRSGWGNTALLSSGNTPLPAYNAYQFARNELGDAKFVQPIDSYPGVMGSIVSRNGKQIWVLWSIGETSDVSITLPGTPSAVWTWDSTSNQYISGTPAPSLTVGRAPIYLEMNP